jgi:putative transposase
MVKIRRYHVDNAVYFITNVTYDRQPILINDIALLRESAAEISKRHRFEILAHVILPDHFHLILDPKAGNVSNILQRIKMSFAARHRKQQGLRSGRVWQNRFWDHIIRDNNDMNRHVDYIHYNPVKHGIVKSPFDWAHSSIDRYHRNGYYQRDWGATEGVAISGEYGE